MHRPNSFASSPLLLRSALGAALLGSPLATLSCGNDLADPSGAPASSPAGGSAAGTMVSNGTAGSAVTGPTGGVGGSSSAGATYAGAGSDPGGAAGTGGGGNSGGSVGGGGGGSVAGASCQSGYLLCEDFEGTGVAMVPSGWTAHGMASVAEDQARGGKRSLKISPTNNGERRIYHPTPMLGGEHWGRVHYRVKLPVPVAFVHSTLVTFFGKGPTVGDAEFRLVDTVKNESGKHQFLYNVQPNGAEFGMGSSYDYAFEEKWQCAEWHVNAADQSYHFYFEGKEVLAFSKGAGNYQGSELPMSFVEVRLGWNNYQSAPPGFTAWLDDFAVDDARIGCAQ